METIEEIKGKKVLVDTNILINCGREEFGADFKKILRTLVDNKNSLAISVVSGFEIIKKYNQVEKVSNYYIKLLNYIQNIEIDLKTMNIAGIMANKLYDKKDNYKKDNDYIIGATVIKNKSLLLTCNLKDFNKPFWNIVARSCISWESEDDCRKIENVFLLESNENSWGKIHNVNLLKFK